VNKPSNRNLETGYSSFQVDEQFSRTLLRLMVHYGTPSKAHVLRKAVALLRLAQQNEQADGSVVIRDSHGRYVKVVMR